MQDPAFMAAMQDPAKSAKLMAALQGPATSVTGADLIP